MPVAPWIPVNKKIPSKIQGLIKENEIESPEPERPKKKGKRGRFKKTKSRNSLERRRDYETMFSDLWILITSVLQ